MRKKTTVPAAFTSETGRKKAGLTLEIADTFFKRMRGLSKRSSLEPGFGMLFPRVGAFWMKGMRFPLDLVYLDRDRRVVETVRMPLDRGLFRRIYRPSSRNVRQAVELPAGWMAEHGIGLGDRLEMPSSRSRRKADHRAGDSE